MDAINLTETLIGREVERLFSENPAQSNGLCTNPVTGQYYVRGVDPIAPQKEAAYRALLAREWFAFTAPRRDAASYQLARPRRLEANGAAIGLHHRVIRSVAG